MAAFHPLDPRGARARLLAALAIGGLVWWFAPSSLAPVTRALLAGDAAGLALLAVTGWIIVHTNNNETRRRAAAEDPGRFAVWLIVLCVSAVSLFASIFIMRQAHSAPASDRELLLVLAVATSILAWLLTHTAFTLRYAHLFYRAGKADEGGLEFPNEEEPDDLDFAYFAFTVGMCFQVSDVQITSRLIRRAVTMHSLISFAYNTGILAVVINVVLANAS